MKTFCQYVCLMALMAFCSMSHAEDWYQKATCQVNAQPFLKIPEDYRGKAFSKEVEGKGTEACADAKRRTRNALEAQIHEKYRSSIICSKICEPIRY